MSSRATIHLDGHQVVVEADSPQQLAETVRAMLATQPKPTTIGDLVAAVLSSPKGGAPRATESGGDASEDQGRNPRGHNAKLVLQALAAAGPQGLVQAHVQKWISLNKNEGLAVSSVRHALNQLQERGHAMRTGDIWRISGDGVRELAGMKILDQWIEEPESSEEDDDLPF